MTDEIADTTRLALALKAARENLTRAQGFLKDEGDRDILREVLERVDIIPIVTTCECGCGEPVKIGTRFVRFHQSRPRPTIVRFLAKIDPACPSGMHCWMWIGTKTNSGYGTLIVRPGRAMAAHRFAYEYFRAPIPEGLVLDHLCVTRNCVNPWHVEPVPNCLNLRRGQHDSGREHSRSDYRDYCKQGHPLTPENTYEYQRWRKCRICRAESVVRCRERRRVQK